MFFDNIKVDCQHSAETFKKGATRDDSQWTIQLKDDDLNSLVQSNNDGAFVYTFNETDDSGYAITGTLIFRQPVLCTYYDNLGSSDSPHLNQSCDTIDMNIASGNTVFTYTDTSNTSKSITDNYSIKYNTTVMANESGTYTLILKWDDSCKLTSDGLPRLDLTSSVNRDEFVQNFTVDMVANTYYPIFIEFYKSTGDSKLQLYWIRPGQSTEEIVPQQNLWFDHYYGGQRIELNVTCPTEHASRNLQNDQSTNEVCGDGLRNRGEQWDDSNTKSGDGWSSEWVVEKGYICTGGSNVTADQWVRCPIGYKSFRYFENSDYVLCIPEDHTYNAVFYITVAFLVIGMMKHLIYNFIMYLIKKEERIEPRRKIDQNKRNFNGIQIHADGEGTQSQVDEEQSQSQADEEESQDMIEAQIINSNENCEDKEDTNHIQLHR